MKSIARGYIDDETECIVTDDCIYIGHYLSGDKIYPDEVADWQKTQQQFINSINNYRSKQPCKQ